METTIETPAEIKDVKGDAVTDTAGKLISAPIAMSVLAKPVAPKSQITKDAVLALMKEAGFQFSDVNSVADDLISRMEEQQRKQKRDVLKIQLEEDTKKLRAVHEKLIAAIAPIIAEAGIKMDIPGKQIVYHVGDAGSPCWDIAYPEPLSDKASKGNGNGGIRVRKAIVMGEVHMRIPELSVNEKCADSLSAFFKYWMGRENHGFATATVAAQNIGDSSEGKSGQDGLFKVQNVPAILEAATTMGSKAYNIVTLTEKGYRFFNIMKGKVVPTATTPAPVAIATEADKPANWNTMSKADKRAWRHQNHGQAN